MTPWTSGSSPPALCIGGGTVGGVGTTLPPRLNASGHSPTTCCASPTKPGLLGGPSAGLLVITAAWTGCRWGELAGLQSDHLMLDPHRNRGALVIDPDVGALHESRHRLWLGPPKTPASARTITLPPFLVALLRQHLATTPGQFVFTSPLGYRLRHSTFDRRVFRPAVDGDLRKRHSTVRPGLTFHGLRHSHKTWLIADGIPEIAQARRLGHHLSNRLVETYSHVAPRSNTASSRPSSNAGNTPNGSANPSTTGPAAAQRGVHPTRICAAHHPTPPRDHRPAADHGDQTHANTTNSEAKLPPEFLHLSALRRSSTNPTADHRPDYRDTHTRQDITPRRFDQEVDLVGAYSKHLDLAKRLARTAQQAHRLEESTPEQPASVRSTGRSERHWRVSDRLGDADVHQLVKAFESGTPKWKLAEQYGISESSVKRLIRRHRTRRTT